MNSFHPADIATPDYVTEETRVLTEAEKAARDAWDAQVEAIRASLPVEGKAGKDW